MRQTSRHLEKDRSGSIGLVAEEAEDMWHAYNLIAKGDLLRSTTLRRVVTQSSTGSTDKTSVRITLTIAVESVEFDAQGCMLRINGRNAEENKYVKMGGYHTIDLELNRPFTLTKEEWDTVALERVTSACDVGARADIAAIVMEEGLANLCLVTTNMTIVRQRIEVNVPRKRKGSSHHEKAVAKYLDHVYQAILKHVNFDVVKVVIVASPGFYKEQLLEYVKATAVRTDNRAMQQALPKFLLVHCSSGQKHALAEALADPTIQSRLAETKFAQEVQQLSRFYATLAQDPAKAFYGFRHVAAAAERAAVETCLVSDELFRAADVAKRRQYIALIEQVRAQGGTVLIFSSMHNSGEQLNQLTGIAAILNFALPELEDLEEEDAAAAA
ncbi:eRF1 domain 1-domain-containing protein [Zopfochytrium polystomum]|nr:eRF1 domain 1-domain-containing protein [Zopfochytrium polystomum]